MLIKALVRNSREFTWCGNIGCARSRDITGPVAQVLFRSHDGTELLGFVVQSAKTGSRLTFIEVDPLTINGRTFTTSNGAFSIIISNT